MKNETITAEDLTLDPEDNPRDEALERGILSATLHFNGEKLLPVSAGSMALLQRTKNGIIFGDSSNLLFDAASFVMIHTSDEVEHDRNVDLINERNSTWPRNVIKWLDATPEAQAKLTLFAPQIAGLMNDYGSSLTKQLESHESGNAGGRIG